MTQISRSDVSVVSVCYKSDSVIDDMVHSIPDECPIIVIDNGNMTRFGALPTGRNIEVFPLDENIGFGPGCNEGAKRVTTSWILFLNPDVRLNTDTIDQLVEAAKKYPLASAFNPRIMNSDGSPYFKRRSYLLPKHEYMKRGWPVDDCELPILSGAAILVSKSKFDEVGGFDPNIFLYHEDDDLSLRLRKLGPLMFVRKASITHAGGRSSERSPEIAYFKAYHLAQSRIYVGKKHSRPYPTIFAILQVAYQLILPITYFSPRRLQKTKGYLFGILKA